MCRQSCCAEHSSIGMLLFVFIGAACITCHVQHSKADCTRQGLLITGVLSAMQCIGTWLNGMTDPTIIADGLATLDTYITGPFQTITSDVTSALTAYAVSCAAHESLQQISPYKIATADASVAPSCSGCQGHACSMITFSACHSRHSVATGCHW